MQQNIDLQKLLAIIKGLSAAEKEQVREALGDDVQHRPTAGSQAKLDALLLKGPVMEPGQEAVFREIRKRISEWRAT